MSRISARVAVVLFLFLAAPLTAAENDGTGFQVGPVAGVGLEFTDELIVGGLSDGSNKEVQFHMDSEQELWWAGVRFTGRLPGDEDGPGSKIKGFFEAGALIGNLRNNDMLKSFNESGVFFGTGAKVWIFNLSLRYYRSTVQFNGSEDSTDFRGTGVQSRLFGELRFDTIISPVIAVGTRSFSPGDIQWDYGEGIEKGQIRSTKNLSWMIGLEIDFARNFSK